MASLPVRRSPRVVKPTALFESSWKIMSRRRKIKKIPSPSVVPPPRRSKRKSKTPGVSKVEKLNGSKKELFGRKLRLESFLRVLYKVQQSGIPNEKYSVTRLNQKIKEINELLEEISEALSGWENKHSLEMSQTDVNIALATGEAPSENDVFANGNGLCIVFQKLPAMCKGDDLYTAIAANELMRVKQSPFGEGSVVEKVKRFHQMG